MKTTCALLILLAMAGGQAQACRVLRFFPACGFILAVLALSATSRALWLHRYEAVPGVEPLVLSHHPEEVAKMVAGNPKLPEKPGEGMELIATAVPPQVAYQWQGLPTSDRVYISTEVGCKDLKLGKAYDWQDGRIFVIWFDEKGRMLSDFLSIWSGRGNRPVKFYDMILPIRRQGGLPRLVIENLGSTGQMKVKSLTVQAVRARPEIPWAAAGLLIIWMVVLTWGTRLWITRRGQPLWRSVAVAVLCLGFVWTAAFPGPWVPLRPILGRFAITPVAIPESPAPPQKPESTMVDAGAEQPVPEAATEPEPVAEKAPEPRAFPSEAKGPPAKLAGGLLRSFMFHLPGLKIWVHFLVFTGLAAVLAGLTGSRRAAYVAGALGFTSEFCEWAYGFGVDWGDAGDLAMDATAILVGLILWKFTARWLVKRWQLRLS